jgi:hypothetical protein
LHKGHACCTASSRHGLLHVMCIRKYWFSM